LSCTFFLELLEGKKYKDRLLKGYGAKKKSLCSFYITSLDFFSRYKTYPVQNNYELGKILVSLIHFL